jgi:hypothetical protein
MFFFGININLDNKLTDFVILKKTQKNLKKHYTLISEIYLQKQLDNKEITEQIILHYNNRKYSIRKRIYNQNNRPSKSVLTYPKIIIGFLSKKSYSEKNSLVDELRSKIMPIEAVITGDFKDVLKKEYGKALGDNYFVPKKNICENILNLYNQKRLIIDEKFFLKNDLKNILNSKIDFFKQTSNKKKYNANAFLQAASYPLWFRENIKYKRAYST